MHMLEWKGHQGVVQASAHITPIPNTLSNEKGSDTITKAERPRMTVNATLSAACERYS